MYNPNNKQYIFKQTSGKVWNFFHDERLGLCYSTLTKRNTWTEPVSLQKNIHSSFFVDIDYNDFFHILFQDKQGNIFCSRFGNTNIDTAPILNSKSPSAYNKHMRLIPFKNNMHFLFVIHHNDSTILAHQTMIDGSVSSPKVVDYVVNSSCPYSMAYDNLGNIYAFYQSSDGKHLQLGYKKYIASQKFWGEFTPITKGVCDCDSPSVLIDADNIMHVCYQRRAAKQYEIVYQQKVPDKNIWTNEILVHTSAYPFNEPSVVFANGNLIVYWVRDDNIYASSSSNKGETWSKPARHNFSFGRQLICMLYKTNSPYESDKIIANEIPGTFLNGFKLAFYQDASENTNNLSADDLKNMIVDGFKMLKSSVEDLRESNTKMKEDISSVSSYQYNLEKDMIKLSVKVDLLENEINKIKQIAGQLEAYKNSPNELKSYGDYDSSSEYKTFSVDKSSSELKSFSDDKSFTDIKSPMKAEVLEHTYPLDDPEPISVSAIEPIDLVTIEPAATDSTPENIDNNPKSIDSNPKTKSTVSKTKAKNYKPGNNSGNKKCPKKTQPPDKQYS